MELASQTRGLCGRARKLTVLSPQSCQSGTLHQNKIQLKPIPQPSPPCLIFIRAVGTAWHVLLCDQSPLLLGEMGSGQLWAAPSSPSRTGHLALCLPPCRASAVTRRAFLSRAPGAVGSPGLPSREQGVHRRGSPLSALLALGLMCLPPVQGRDPHPVPRLSPPISTAAV